MRELRASAAFTALSERRPFRAGLQDVPQAAHVAADLPEQATANATRRGQLQQGQLCASSQPIGHEDAAFVWVHASDAHLDLLSW